MLSYQHIYHAGNFADVHKHALLVKTLAALKVRHPRLTVVDTHAGRGLYDLSSPEAQKKGEFRNGIEALKETGDSPISDYLALARKYGEAAYPGSACLAKDMLRPSDRLVLAELHPGEFDVLKANMADAPAVALHKKNGFDVMAETLPPPTLRGLAVIDPPYEIKTDYAEVPRRVHLAWKKWPQGAFFIWYPLLTSEPHLKMLTDLRRTGIGNILVSEMKLGKMPEEGFAMHGSGVAIVNPPLPETSVADVTRHIAQALSAEAEVFWLANRKIDPETGLIA